MGGMAAERKVSQPTKWLYSQSAARVPRAPLSIARKRLERPVMLAKPRPEAYSALSLVVQMFRPRTRIAGISRPWAIITSEMSDLPTAAAPAAPKMNISELPRKNATRHTTTAVRALRPKRTKSAVRVPALTNEPTTRAIAVERLSGALGVTCCSAARPPASRTASHTE
ncbi:hypothetical protein PAERUG_E16_London_17_VIM_2_04_14_00432 [Pseudomonas aeruginosa]|nr:hypothetical protein PAERUG_E16_London_17_VIM_2_04_14_00432 [Pseudomonas aeruginosa]